MHNKALNRLRVGIVCLFHVVLGNYIIHNFNDEMFMGRNVRARKDCLFSHVVLGNYKLKLKISFALGLQEQVQH